MRATLLALVVMNLALAAAIGIGLRQSGSDDVLGPDDDQSGKITLLTSQPAENIVRRCMELGPFDAEDALIARRMLDGLSFADRISSVEMLVTSHWWVYISPRQSHADALRRVRDLDRLGVAEYQVVEESGPMQHAISLGVFRSLEVARTHLADLASKGVRGLKVAPREPRVKQTLFYTQEAGVEALASLTQVKAQFAEVKLRQVTCPNGGRAPSSAQAG
jgi:hypothetical protein